MENVDEKKPPQGRPMGIGMSAISTEHSAEATVTDDDMRKLRHTLGVCDHKPKSTWGYRNYFAAGAGQVESMERLVYAGYMMRGSKPFDLTYYHATEAGMDAIGMSKAAKRRAMEP